MIPNIIRVNFTFLLHSKKGNLKNTGKSHKNNNEQIKIATSSKFFNQDRSIVIAADTGSWRSERMRERERVSE